MLTGAGVSAESGIPTFRGKEGYWTIGAREYHPQELATHDAFERMPWEVWAWYLYRRTVCNAAEPNDGHRALVSLGAALPDRFALVTQLGGGRTGEVWQAQDAQTGETVLTAGMFAGYRAGEANGHHLVNRGARDATFEERGPATGHFERAAQKRERASVTRDVSAR